MPRLLLVVSVAMLPALGFHAYTEHAARGVREQLVKDEALRLVRLVSSEQQRIVEGAEQVLDTISGAPAVQDNRPEICQRLLANMLSQLPRYAYAAVIGLDGHLVCGPTPFDRSIDLSDRPHFRLALQTGGFVIGEYAVGRVSEKPSIHMAKPFLTSAGIVAGVVDVALDLEWLGAQLKRLPLPPGAVASVRDRNGTVLAHYPDAYVGSAMPAASLSTLQGNEVQATDLKGPDGVTRLVAYTPLGVGPGGLRIAVGLDRDAAYAAVTQTNRTGLLLIVGGVGLALALAAIGGRFLIRRPLDRLLRVADRWRTGDLAARTGLRENSSEFGRLAGAFDRMAVALEARERALRTALESTTDSVIVLDRTWRFSYLNERAKGHIAQGRDLLGQVIWDVFPELAKSPFADAGREAMETGVPKHTDGISVLFHVHFEAHSYPSNEGLTIFFRDVTEERRLAAALRESEERHIAAVLRKSEERFRATFEQAAVGMAQVGLDGAWLRVNDKLCQITGYTRAELLALTFRNITHPDDLADSLAHVRGLLAGENTTYTMEKRYLRADEGSVWINNTVSLLRDAEGRPDRLIAVIEDITARKRAESELHRLTEELEVRVREEVAAREAAQVRAAQAERMQALGLLSGGIAHDFNNVLQAVEGAAMLIERRPGDETGVRRLARIVIDAAGRGASVTRRLLAFGRRGDLRAEPLDVADLLSSLHEIFVHTLGAAIEVSVSVQTGLPPLLADKGQLETALVNLATNARDAMPKGGRLTLSAESAIVFQGSSTNPDELAPGRYVRLTVADTGTGMDAATLAHAGEPFFTTKKPGIGTGLGLPMAKGFAEQSGGALTVESRHGKGTTVALWLPEADSDWSFVAVAPKGASDESGPETRRKALGRLLVVDDEDLVRQVLAEHLEYEGFDVLAVANGTEALAMLAAGEAVDALVTDLSMPGMDGLALIRAAQERRPWLPAVLLTGYAGDDAALAVGGAITGAFSLLRKPIRIHDLVARVQALLAAGANRAR